jgi:RNA-directed DNA polymerase
MNHNREEPFVLSNRPKRQQLTLGFDDLIEADNAAPVEEPQRGQSDSATTKQPSLDRSQIDLMEKIVENANMEAAWKNVRRNAGAPGPDGITVDEFPEWLQPRWPDIRQQLLEGGYRPAPARRKAIPKPDGGERQLGIPNVLDRLIQQAILQILTPIFDPHFSESSFGFRPKRSAHGAIKQIQRTVREGYRHCVDMDLSKFFDRVQHDVLLVRVARQVHDRRLLKLIGRYLRAGVLMVDGVVQPSPEGTMQGGPLSPLLANVLLDDFDKELEQRGLRFVRYADDFLVFVRTPEAAQRVYQSVARYLTQRLKLVVNQQKSQVCSTNGVEFLGYRFHGFGGQIRVSEKNVLKFQRRCKEITRRNRGVSMSSRLKELAQYVRGWTAYFCLEQRRTLFRELDKWLRRRIRACYWKWWRRPKTKIRKLLSLGVRLDEAISHGCSRKGPWRMSGSRAIQTGMPVTWLTERGLLSLEEIWIRFAPKR